MSSPGSRQCPEMTDAERAQLGRLSFLGRPGMIDLHCAPDIARRSIGTGRPRAPRRFGYWVEQIGQSTNSSQSLCFCEPHKQTSRFRSADHSEQSSARAQGRECFQANRITLSFALLMDRAASFNCGRKRSIMTGTVATLAIHVRLMHPTTSSPA